MLAALRGQRADESAAGLKPKPARLWARAYSDLKPLVDQPGVKMQTGPDCSVQILLAHESLHGRAEKLALAMQRQPGKASLSAGPSTEGPEPRDDTDPA